VCARERDGEYNKNIYNTYYYDNILLLYACAFRYRFRATNPVFGTRSVSENIASAREPVQRASETDIIHGHGPPLTVYK